MTADYGRGGRRQGCDSLVRPFEIPQRMYDCVGVLNASPLGRMVPGESPCKPRPNNSYYHVAYDPNYSFVWS